MANCKTVWRKGKVNDQIEKKVDYSNNNKLMEYIQLKENRENCNTKMQIEDKYIVMNSEVIYYSTNGQEL